MVSSYYVDSGEGRDGYNYTKNNRYNTEKPNREYQAVGSY